MPTSSWGTAFDENLSDEMRVTVVATGFDNKTAEGLRNSLNTSAAAPASLRRLCSAPTAPHLARQSLPQQRQWKRITAITVTTMICWLS